MKKLIWKNELGGSLVGIMGFTLFLKIDMDTVSWVHCLVGKMFVTPQKAVILKQVRFELFSFFFFRDEIIHPDPFIMNWESRLILKRQILVFPPNFGLPRSDLIQEHEWETAANEIFRRFLDNFPPFKSAWNYIGDAWGTKIHSHRKEVFCVPFGSHRFQIPFLMISGLYEYD